jgi:NDP-sugar pyrophosphorylase family protein
LFDERNRLCGRSPEPDPRLQSLGFSGIHVISPRLIGLLPDEEIFSIVTSYLDLAARGESIMGFRADEYDWKDMGKPEKMG